MAWVSKTGLVPWVSSESMSGNGLGKIEGGKVSWMDWDILENKYIFDKY